MAIPKLIARVNLVDETWDIKANPETNRVYFLNLTTDAGAVGVLDATSNRVIDRIRVGRFPIAMEINPRSNRVYISNFRDRTISVINGRTNRVIKTVKVGLYSDSIGVYRKGNQIYVAGGGSGNVYVIDGKTNRVRTTIRLGGRPSDFAINEQNNRIYVTNTGNNTVSVIHGSTQAVIATIKVGDNPVIRPAINMNTNRIYVPNNLSRFLSVIDGRTNKLLRNIQLGRLQSDIVINPRTNLIYVSSAQVEGLGKLFVINGRTDKIMATMVLPNSSSLFVNPKTNHLFISDFDKNRIYVFNATSLTRISTFTSVAGNFSLNPATNRIYVAGGRSISVIQDIS